MPNQAIKRWTKWVERYTGDSKPACISEALKSEIKDRLYVIFDDQVKVEEEIKVVLAEAGVPTIQNPFYQGFGKQIRSLMLRGISGGQLINEVDVLLNVWVARGLDRDVLERVRNTVFAIPAPASP
ncbi:MAG: hypothetical protein ABIK31_04465 [candidate division WOR-3 bacterium]